MTAARVPRWHRWALVTRDAHGYATVRQTFYTWHGSQKVLVRAALARRNGDPQADPPLEREPTDWAPLVERQIRVMNELHHQRAASVTTLAGRTAMSPRVVEQILLEFGRRGWARYRALAVAGEDRTWAGVWRPTTEQERATFSQLK